MGLRARVMKTGRGVGLWRRVARPTAEDWTDYLRRHGGFREMGEGCRIAPGAIFTDPEYTRIGNNVRIAEAWISGHDGSVNMINAAYGTRLDAVGPVVLRDDVFIGRGVTILPGVTIGPRAIVGAGSVISRDVPPNSVVAGNPARVVRSLDDHAEVLKRRNAAYSWRHLIEERAGGFDPALEPELKRLRTRAFFGDSASG